MPRKALAAAATLLTMAVPVQALAATLLSAAPHGNRIDLKLDRGSAEILWVTPSAFRFRRVLEGELPRIAWSDHENVAVAISDTPSAIKLRTRTIEVTLVKSGVLVQVSKLDGGPLMQDSTEPRSEAAGVVWERKSPVGGDFYGLGSRPEPTFGLRGRSLRADTPFLVSTAGYGEFHEGSGTYRFDFTDPAKYRVQGPEIDYSFYFGPTIKEVFEAHNIQHKEPAPWVVPGERFGSWTGLRAELLRIVQGGMSAMTVPVLDLSRYAGSPDELKLRARQLGSLVARVVPGPVGTSGFRKQLDTFFATYVAELQDRGFPIWHPLPWQFPDDPEAARHADEFMLGDEMLVAPIVDPGDKRTAYIPRGIWTNLETNDVVRGPATVNVETKSLPVWARNGGIVPLDATNGMALHYFPKLGGEFFLLETDIGDYSQVHAAPALDFMRLEIESKKDRDYQWVVHNLDKPSGVGFEEEKYREVATLKDLADRSWFYDAAAKNVHIRVKVKAGEDCRVNMDF